MSVAKRGLAHVGELDVALGAGVHENVALRRVELGGGDDFRQLLHVYGFDIHDV